MRFCSVIGIALVCGSSAACNASTSSTRDATSIDVLVADLGVTDARTSMDVGSSVDGGGADDAGAASDASTDVPAVDGGATSACSLLATCCSHVTSPPEFHDGCVAAVANGNDAQCMAVMAQDCCGGLSQCCAMQSGSSQLLCMEVVSSNDGRICQSSIATYCGP